MVLDAAFQRALSALYPPFEITAPIVLSQVFRIIESDYHGDGLCCLLDFLIPAKRLLERIRHVACAPYSENLFLHEGWPLCLREKVVVHLAPLSPFLLRPGDFYLQAGSCGEQSACVVLKYLSEDLHTVEEKHVLESSYLELFTKEWLEAINRGLEGVSLHTCLVATDSGIAKVPWTKITVPEFVRKPKVIPNCTSIKGSRQSDQLDLNSSIETCIKQRSSFILGKTDFRMSTHDVISSLSASNNLSWKANQELYPGLVKPDLVGSLKKLSTLATPSLTDVVSQDFEGDYVDLLEISEEKKLDSSAKSLSPDVDSLSSPVMERSTDGMAITMSGNTTFFPFANVDCSLSLSLEEWACGKVVNSEDGDCTPCLRRKLNKEVKPQEMKCRYRESYMAALQNPVNFGSGLMTSILEESDKPKKEALSTNLININALKSRPRNLKSHGQAVSARMFSLSPHKTSAQHTKAEIQTNQREFNEPKSSVYTNKGLSGSDSPTSANKFSFFKNPRMAASSGDNFPSETVTNQHEGPRKRMSSVCSPRFSRAKPAGKAMDRTSATSLEVTSIQKMASRKGLWISVVGAPIKEPVLTGLKLEKPILCQDLSAKLLYSGIACLPGSRDKLGRSFIQLTTDSPVWDAPWCTDREVAQLLLYLSSFPRKEIRDMGLIVVVDGRKQLPSPILYSALQTVQVSSSACIHSLLILVEKEAASSVEKLPGVQVEVLTSLKTLNRYIENGQLTWDLGGTFPYCHSEWVQFCQKLDPFIADLRKASELLQNSIQELDQDNQLEAAQEAAERISKYRDMMKTVLNDTQLVSLQREGGATLARLRKEASHLSFSEDVRNAVDSAVALYNQMEEKVHALVTKSNKSLEQLESLLKIRELECEFNKLIYWMDREGANQLHQLATLEWSLENIERAHQQFTEFFNQATAHYNCGITLFKEATEFKGSIYPEIENFMEIKSIFQTKLIDFFTSVERQKVELDTMLNLYRFCEKITKVIFDCNHHLTRLKLEERKVASPETLKCLESYLQKLTAEFSAERFQEMKVQAYALSSCKGLALWNETWLKCQETKQLLEETLEKSKEDQQTAKVCDSKREESSGLLVKDSASTELEEEPHNCKADVDELRSGGRMGADSTMIARCNFGIHLEAEMSRTGQKTTVSSKDDKYGSVKEDGVLCAPQESNTTGEAEIKASDEEDPEDRKVVAQNSNNEALENLHAPIQNSPVLQPSQPNCLNTRHCPWTTLCRSHSHEYCSLSTSQAHPFSRHASFSSEHSSSQHATEGSSLICHFLSVGCTCPSLPWVQGMNSEITHVEENDTNNQENPNFVRLWRIMEELLSTEKDYVFSLGYILSHYLPEMERGDLPQGLRGQHAAIFGNLEKLYDFHSQRFLQELKECWKDPLRVGRCFLRHKNHFRLYAFYSKNKPQSDMLLAEHGAAFFKRKQHELGDKMDLSSYLLKPIQRISKYNLLLEDMLRECDPSRDKARSELQAAQQVVRFQLRHGNDLLAMDDIQDCDVNLKEQGQLLRQDEFMVLYRKKKCSRHIFLFQDLILFSKTKKSIYGNDIYVYKQSFKTSEIGLTHTSGGSALCFEIWFRRRKSQDTYILQASSMNVKEDWTTDLQTILWDQAIKNRELRRQERALAGLGCKPFTDIQPSEAAISDRAVNCTHFGKAFSPSFQDGSIPTQPLKSIGSGSSAGSASSLGEQSSSSSGCGSLNPLSCPQAGAVENNKCFCYIHICLEEKRPHRERKELVFLTDSSGSSEGSIYGFSSSESSNLSLTGGETEDVSSTDAVSPRLPHSQHASVLLTPLAGRRELP
ncbi:uncharacterized protein KIAA1755 homolog isoform X2 [Microcaecilia unicolor]|uniref:Uncharacterized protein KIAA1755 homolog isoform X2 n=1 Tax=Microcaecilia unicolor TaxID=1415580 RepID=A0A6P7YR37_9AMPH|nr:uncharacterized protein KIAA1755 homolog isoform X2 [Microcaecilia unicolor]